MRVATAGALALAGLVALSQAWPAPPAAAEKDGVDSPSYFPPIGCGDPDIGFEQGCHVQLADPELVVTLTGPTSLEPGGFGVYEASIPSDFVGCGPNFDGTCLGAGINVKIGGASNTACELDTFAAPNLKLENSPSSVTGVVLSHSDAETPTPNGNIGAFSYTFLLSNCGAPGNLVLLAAMNAFDGSGDETGEAWNKTELQITVPEADAGAAAVAAAAALATARRRRRA